MHLRTCRSIHVTAAKSNCAHLHREGHTGPQDSATVLGCKAIRAGSLFEALFHHGHHGPPSRVGMRPPFAAARPGLGGLSLGKKDNSKASTPREDL